jgi:hypothetical protein
MAYDEIGKEKRCEYGVNKDSMPDQKLVQRFKGKDQNKT